MEQQLRSGSLEAETAIISASAYSNMTITTLKSMFLAENVTWFCTRLIFCLSFFTHPRQVSWCLTNISHQDTHSVSSWLPDKYLNLGVIKVIFKKKQCHCNCGPSWPPDMWPLQHDVTARCCSLTDLWPRSASGAASMNAPLNHVEHPAVCLPLGTHSWGRLMGGITVIFCTPLRSNQTGFYYETVAGAPKL